MLGGKALLRFAQHIIITKSTKPSLFVSLEMAKMQKIAFVMQQPIGNNIFWGVSHAVCLPVSAS